MRLLFKFDNVENYKENKAEVRNKVKAITWIKDSNETIFAEPYIRFHCKNSIYQSQKDYIIRYTSQTSNDYELVRPIKSGWNEIPCKYGFELVDENSSTSLGYHIDNIDLSHYNDKCAYETRLHLNHLSNTYINCNGLRLDYKTSLKGDKLISLGVQGQDCKIDLLNFNPYKLETSNSGKYTSNLINTNVNIQVNFPNKFSFPNLITIDNVVSIKGGRIDEFYAPKLILFNSNWQNLNYGFWDINKSQSDRVINNLTVNNIIRHPKDTCTLFSSSGLVNLYMNNLTILNTRRNNTDFWSLFNQYSECNYFMNNMTFHNNTSDIIKLEGNNILSLHLSNFKFDNKIKYLYLGFEKLNYLDITGLDLNMFYGKKISFNCNNLSHIKCNRDFYELCINNAEEINLPKKMRLGGEGTWEIVE